MTLRGGAYRKYKKNRKMAIGRDVCMRCGRPGRAILITSDHIVPLSKGGSNDATNLQCLCSECNVWKADKHIDYTGQSGMLRTPLYELNNHQAREKIDEAQEN